MANKIEKTAWYHNTDAAPVKLAVLAENEDGTVNIGERQGDKDVVMVRQCPVSKSPKSGHCTLGDTLPKSRKPTAEEPLTEPLPEETNKLNNE